MTAMDALLQYAMEERFPAYLAGRDHASAARRERDLRSDLNAGQLQRLEAFLSAQSDLWCLEDDALFRLGVSIGLELSRG